MSMTGDYANRSDLRNPATSRAEFTGQTYGESAAQQRAQDVVPAGAAPQDVAAQRAAASVERGVRPGAKPLGRPTERAEEPITSGANFGPGPNAMAAGIRPRVVSKDNIEIQLEQLYRMYPTEGVALLLERIRNAKMNRGRIR